MYADVPGYRNPAVLFNKSRPDVVLRKNNTLYIFELTVCFETNTEKSRQYKVDCYQKIEEEVTIPFDSINKYYIEITSLGFKTKNINNFTKVCNTNNLTIKRLLNKMAETAIRASFYIYMRRNKPWTI